MGLFLLFLTPGVLGQTPVPSSGPPHAPEVRKLNGADEERAKRLDEQIDKGMKEDRWDEAILGAEKLVALWSAFRVRNTRRSRVRSRGYRLIGSWRRWGSTSGRSSSPPTISAGWPKPGKSRGSTPQAQPLFEKALEIRRRLLTDDHPDTATSYNSLADNLDAQGKYAAAQPLFEKALEIRRRLLTDDHPDTATELQQPGVQPQRPGEVRGGPAALREGAGDPPPAPDRRPPRHRASYNNLASNLNGQGKYAAAQPLFEKALEIRRRLLTDDHPDTATSYNNLARNLNAQGKYAAAQPLFEKALEIRRRLLDRRPPRHRDRATTTWRLNLTPRGSTRRPSRSSRRRWRSAAGS